MNDSNTLAQTLRAAGQTLFSDRASMPKNNAQAALDGRTHYAEDSTLRYFHARILSAHECRSGCFFYIIESCALDANNTSRGFRAVVFDVFGTVVYRPDLQSTYRTNGQARKAMWAWFDAFDEVQHYADALRRKAARLEREAAEMRAAVATLESAEVAA